MIRPEANMLPRPAISSGMASDIFSSSSSSSSSSSLLSSSSSFSDSADFARGRFLLLGVFSKSSASSSSLSSSFASSSAAMASSSSPPSSSSSSSFSKSAELVKASQITLRAAGVTLGTIRRNAAPAQRRKSLEGAAIMAMSISVRTTIGGSPSSSLFARRRPAASVASSRSSAYSSSISSAPLTSNTTLLRLRVLMITATAVKSWRSERSLVLAAALMSLLVTLLADLRASTISSSISTQKVEFLAVSRASRVLRERLRAAPGCCSTGVDFQKETIISGLIYALRALSCSWLLRAETNFKAEVAQ
mmetsp:Transcript_13623/g.26302  ORF Transcript_13623/g.26302 Transcript_13623/m.26302 type:complete len:306 (-) Transcript_13623:1712-2629(-)